MVQRQGIKSSKAGKERHKGRPGKAHIREKKNNKGRQRKRTSLSATARATGALRICNPTEDTV